MAAPRQGNVTSTTPNDLPLTGPKMQLAGYTVSLPPGFTPLPTAGPNGAVSAASPTGSIDLLLGAGKEFPVKGGEELKVGTHRAYLGIEPTTGRLELDVLAVPASPWTGPTGKWVVVRATGVPKETLTKVALEVPMPESSYPPPSGCGTHGCG
jgi:hypothetical protein